MDSSADSHQHNSSSASVEQLQQLRAEQRDHVLALPHRRKLAKLASCRHCDVSGCRCPGWIPSTGTSLDDSSEIDSRTSSDTSSHQTACKTCSHDMEDHGCADLAEKCSENLIFGLVCLSQDVVALYSSVQSQVDADAKQVYFYVYKQLRRSLDTLQMPNQPLFKPSPPFEQQPSISRLLANFIHFRFVQQPPTQISIDEAVQLASLYLDVFDVWQLPVPSQLMPKLSKDRDFNFENSFHNADQSDILAWYRTAFSQWLCHCRIPATSARLTLPCWRSTAIFGVRLFRLTFPLFRDDLVAHCKAEKSHRDMLSKLVRFLNMIQTDLRRNEQLAWLQQAYASTGFEQPKFLQAPALIDSGISIERAKSISSEMATSAATANVATNQNADNLMMKGRKRRQSSAIGVVPGSSSLAKVTKHEPISKIPGDVPSPVVSEILKNCSLTEFAPQTPHQTGVSSHHHHHHHHHHPPQSASSTHAGVPVHRLATQMRDERARLDYLNGILSVHVVNNSVAISALGNSDRGCSRRSTSTELSLFLLAAQNIFTAQLPRMPRPYVSRLVFDPKHRTLVLVKRTESSTPVSLPSSTPTGARTSGGGVTATPSSNAAAATTTTGTVTPTGSATGHKRVIGAICFCAFPSRQFSEVVFCAVSAEEQVRGFGTFMMSCLKEWHVQHGYRHLLTYADEFAVGYFLKQGFSADFNLPKSHYEGFIKEYEGATLMACQLEPNVPYTHLTIGIRQLRRVIEALAVRRRREVAVRRPGLSCFGDGVRQIPIESIPGACEAGWSDETAGEDGQELAGDPDSLFSNLRHVLNQVKAHQSAWPFLKPVEKSEAPDYYDVIKWPMDLKTITDRLKVRYYHHRRLFIADFTRMFENCRSYNDPPTEYYKCANALEKFFLQKMREVDLLTS